MAEKHIPLYLQKTNWLYCRAIPGSIDDIPVLTTRYIQAMIDERYRILQVLYEIVKDDPHPLQYHCSTREILLRLRGNWQPEYLEELAREQLILVKKSTTVVLVITEKGMEKAKRVFAKTDND